MNRPERRMNDASARELLKKSTYGVLSLTDANGVPYGVPLNYFYAGGRAGAVFSLRPDRTQNGLPPAKQPRLVHGGGPRRHRRGAL
jgi:nitroimidazol reductase NimA-like FMN-containing flavoprotein (pyridoxamine 5'-phosphate oxidase superfamily)